MRRTDLRTLFKFDDLENILCISVITTEFAAGNNCEIIGLTVATAEGKFIYDKLYSPSKNADWDLIENIHGLFPEDFVGKPTFEESKGEILEVFDNCRGIFGYDIDLTIGLLNNHGVNLDWIYYRASLSYDFAEILGVWEPMTNNWSSRRLNEIARLFRIDYNPMDRTDILKTVLILSKKASEILTIELDEMRNTQKKIYGEKVHVT